MTELSYTADLRRWSGDATHPEFGRLVALVKWMAPQLADTERGRVFICYRWSDAQDAAGRLYETLTAALGSGRVFMDVETIPPGAEFAQDIRNEIKKSGAVLVLIGPHWTDSANLKRLHHNDDVVRMEIAETLRHGIPLFPILLHGRSVPALQELPEDIRPIFSLNALELSHSRWQTDTHRLLERLRIAFRVHRRQPPEPYPFGARVLVCFGMERRRDGPWEPVVNALLEEYGIEQVYNITHGYTDERLTWRTDVPSAVVAILGGLFRSASKGNRGTYPAPQDRVLRQITIALREGYPLVPVLWSHETMPSLDDVPDELHPLLLRQPVMIDKADPRPGIANMLQYLDKLGVTDIRKDPRFSPRPRETFPLGSPRRNAAGHETN